MLDRESSVIGIGEPLLPHLTSPGMLKIVHCYAHGLTASLIAFLVCSAFISTLYYSYFWLYSALIASFRLVFERMVQVTSRE